MKFSKLFLLAVMALSSIICTLEAVQKIVWVDPITEITHWDYKFETASPRNIFKDKLEQVAAPCVIRWGGTAPEFPTNQRILNAFDNNWRNPAIPQKARLAELLLFVCIFCKELYRSYLMDRIRPEARNFLKRYLNTLLLGQSGEVGREGGLLYAAVAFAEGALNSAELGEALVAALHVPRDVEINPMIAKGENINSYIAQLSVALKAFADQDPINQRSVFTLKNTIRKLFKKACLRYVIPETEIPIADVHSGLVADAFTPALAPLGHGGLSQGEGSFRSIPRSRPAKRAREGSRASGELPASPIEPSTRRVRRESPCPGASAADASAQASARGPERVESPLGSKAPSSPAVDSSEDSEEEGCLTELDEMISGCESYQGDEFQESFDLIRMAQRRRPLTSRDVELMLCSLKLRKPIGNLLLVAAVLCSYRFGEVKAGAPSAAGSFEHWSLEDKESEPQYYRHYYKLIIKFVKEVLEKKQIRYLESPTIGTHVILFPEVPDSETRWIDIDKRRSAETESYVQRLAYHIHSVRFKVLQTDVNFVSDYQEVVMHSRDIALSLLGEPCEPCDFFSRQTELLENILKILCRMFPEVCTQARADRLKESYELHAWQMGEPVGAIDAKIPCVNPSVDFVAPVPGSFLPFFKFRR